MLSDSCWMTDMRERKVFQSGTRSKGSVNLPQGSVKLVVLCKDCTKDYPEKNWDVQVTMEGCEISRKLPFMANLNISELKGENTEREVCKWIIKTIVVYFHIFNILNE